MLRRKTCIIALALMFLTTSKVIAEELSKKETQNLSSTKSQRVNIEKPINKNHWAYKTLEEISKKHGLLMGSPEEKFNGSKPLTRDEAAFILINLVGKIEKDKLYLTETEKVKIDILKQELQEEVQLLTRKVNTLETSVETLKGSISKLEEANQKDWKFDFGEKFKITGGIQAQYTGNIQKGVDNYPSNFALPYSEIRFSGKINPKVNYFAALVPTRMFNGSENGVLREAYTSLDIIPHHTLYLGQTMVPIGYEGPQSPFAIETIDKSQLSRKISDVPDLGVKAEGNWDYISYSIGAYNGGGQNTFDSNGDLSLASWATFKPLCKHPKLGSLELGGGYYTGNNGNINRNITSFYSGYKYKKYSIWGEFLLADGYENQNQKANSFYIHNSLYLTKKSQLIVRFDQFNPNTKVKNDINREYTIGTNYLLADNLSLMLGLVQVTNQAGKNSQRIEALTQFLF